MDKLRFALVGCGDIAHIRYFYAFGKMQTQIELIGLYDQDPAFLCKTAEELGVLAYESFENLLSDERVDAVIVTTYHPSHAVYTIRALSAGKHVLCEKPIATSTEDALLIGEAVRKSGKIYMALPNDAYPHVKAVKRMIEEGTIGDVCAADGVFAHQGPLHAPWFFDAQKAEWGVLADLGVYPISLFSYVFGPVKSVSGSTVMLQKHRTSLAGQPIAPSVEDNMAALLTWPDGKVATMRSNWCTATSKDACVWDVRIYGNRGIIYLNMCDEQLRVVVYSPYAKLDGEKIRYAGFEDCYIIQTGDSDTHTDVLIEFLDAVANNCPIESGGCSIQRQTHVIEIIDRIYESSRTNRTLEVHSSF